MLLSLHTFANTTSRMGTIPALAARRITNYYRLRSVQSFSNFRPVQIVKRTKASLSLSGRQKQAVIILSDMQDLAFFGHELQKLGYTIFSYGGTADALEESGVIVTKVKAISSFIAMLDRKHPDHKEDVRDHDGGALEIVAVNFDYSDDGSPNLDLIDFDVEALLRAALKFKDVLAVVNPQDYPAVIEFLKGKRNDKNFCEKLASKAWGHIYGNNVWLMSREEE